MPIKNAELYFIALIPPTTIAERVTALKHEAKDRFGAKQSLKSPPHITLHMPFKQVETKEQELFGYLAGFAAQFPPQQIRTKGMGCFPPGVIFVDVVQEEALAGMQRKLLEAMRVEFQLFNGLYKELPFHPHMTIAFRDLRKAKFANAWAHFQTKAFDEAFTINELTLLKHNGSEWEIYKQWPFLG